NVASRIPPARGPRKLPRVAGDPCTATERKTCSPWEFPPIPAYPGTANTGLSRRRSRVRVPSLPFRSTPTAKPKQAWRVGRALGDRGTVVAQTTSRLFADTQFGGPFLFLLSFERGQPGGDPGPCAGNQRPVVALQHAHARAHDPRQLERRHAGVK